VVTKVTVAALVAVKVVVQAAPVAHVVTVVVPKSHQKRSNLMSAYCTSTALPAL
jgi:hypothetical protein